MANTIEGPSGETIRNPDAPLSSASAANDEGPQGVRSSAGGGGGGDRKGGFGSGLNVLREDSEAAARFGVEPRVHDVVLPAFGLCLWLKK